MKLKPKYRTYPTKVLGEHHVSCTLINEEQGDLVIETGSGFGRTEDLAKRNALINALIHTHLKISDIITQDEK